MKMPEKLRERLGKLGIPSSIYEMRTRKCILSMEELGFEKVPWYPKAYYIPEKWDEKKNYFVFDPVSLVPCLALDPHKGDNILDMCAAPGTKTFILSFLANNEAKILANDINKFRARKLKFNINKFHLSASVMNASGRKIMGEFDKILLDAPCSGEGMINKKEKLFENWSEKKVKFLAKKQKKLIEHAFSILKPGGLLAYSTCTFEPEENEGVVDFVLKKFDDAAIERMEIKNIVYENGITEWNGKEFDSMAKNCIRIYPQHNNTGGFFVAKISKLK